MNIQKAIYSLFKNGYAVIPSFLNTKKCAQAIKQINKIINQYNPTKDQFCVFSKQLKDRNDYFFKSADKISFFFEEKAFVNGQLIKQKNHSINKIGHALHQKNQIFSNITYQPQIQEICKKVGNLDPVVVQSMAILKPPQIGGQVKQHQDSTFLYDDPQTLLAFWIPFQDATLQNGCLWGIPGSHRAKLYKRTKINWKIKQMYIQNLHQKDYKDEDFIPIQMQKGQLAIFTGRFIHKSLPNTSTTSRYAYTWHLKDGRTTWSSDNWLQRQKFPSLPFTL